MAERQAVGAGHDRVETDNANVGGPSELYRPPVHADQHVGAALELFADVALLFYYILRILLSASNRD